MSMADRDGVIWYDGKLVPWRDANTHVLSHSLHYGLAVFEGVRAYETTNGTQIFRLKDHTVRLLNSAHIYMMRIPYSLEQLMEAQRQVLKMVEHAKRDLARRVRGVVVEEAVPRLFCGVGEETEQAVAHHGRQRQAAL